MADVISPNSAFISGPLTNFAASYANSEFIGDNLVPPFPVDLAGATYQKRLRADSHAAFADDYVGTRGRINEVTYSLEEATYLTKSRGLSHAIPRLTQQVANAALSPKEIGVETVMQEIKLRREIRQADLIMTGGNWATANTGAITNDWDDYVDGAPVTDMKAGIQAIPFNGASVKIYGVCSDIVWDAVSMHPQVMSLRSNGGSEGGPVAPDELAKHLRISGIFVSKIGKLTSVPGVTATYGRVWGSTTFAFVVVPTTLMSTEQMMFGTTFMHNLDGSKNGVRVREWYEPAQGQGGTDMVAVELSDCEKVIQNDAGYLFTSVL
jgi:hypothetical protein